MTKTQIPDAVMKRIRHLLNKTTENGCTEEEASSAAALAQKMLLKWNLGMTDLVDNSTPENEPVVIGENFTDGVDGATPRVSKWKGALLQSVAKANGCHLIYRYERVRVRGRNEKLQRMILIGQERDAAVAKALYEILKDTIEGRCKLNQPAGLGRGEGKSWALSFKLGAVSAISERLRHTRDEVKAELKAIHGTQERQATTALARIDNTGIELHKFLRGMNLRKRPTGNTNIVGDAYERGRLVGSRISLSSKVFGA